MLLPFVRMETTPNPTRSTSHFLWQSARVASILIHRPCSAQKVGGSCFPSSIACDLVDSPSIKKRLPSPFWARLTLEMSTSELCGGEYACRRDKGVDQLCADFTDSHIRFCSCVAGSWPGIEGIRRSHTPVCSSGRAAEPETL